VLPCLSARIYKYSGTETPLRRSNERDESRVTPSTSNTSVNLTTKSTTSTSVEWLMDLKRWSFRNKIEWVLVGFNRRLFYYFIEIIEQRHSHTHAVNHNSHKIALCGVQWTAATCKSSAYWWYWIWCELSLPVSKIDLILGWIVMGIKSTQLNEIEPSCFPHFIP